MTSKLESALKKRRLKNLFLVLQAHGVTDWTVGAITDAELQGFGIGDLKIRRRLLKGFESVAKSSPLLRRWWMSREAPKLRGCPS